MPAATLDPPLSPGVNPGVLPCVIDVEASGFGRGSYPIEVGFVLPDGRAICTLVQPAPGWTHWDPAAEQVHGLSRDLLQRHGRPAHEVAALLNQHLRGTTTYCDGWAHDYSWLALLFEEAGSQPGFRLRHLRELLDEGAVRHWDDTCARVRAQLQLGRHRASSDARVLQLALGQCLQPAGAVTSSAGGMSPGARPPPVGP